MVSGNSSHCDQERPSVKMWLSLSPSPRTKTSPCCGPYDATAGAEVSTPPSDCQPTHCAPLTQLCHSALSVPRANTSRWLGSREYAAGAAFVLKFRLSQSTHRVPSIQ